LADDELVGNEGQDFSENLIGKVENVYLKMKTNLNDCQQTTSLTSILSGTSSGSSLFLPTQKSKSRHILVTFSKAFPD
jgi:hypothetical protein